MYFKTKICSMIIIVLICGIKLPRVYGEVEKPAAGSKLIIDAIEAFNEGRDYSGRIIGGFKVDDIEDHPWQVALLVAAIPDNFYAQFCGGSLIDRSWVLTAAHCVDQGTSPDQVEILYGTTKLDQTGIRVKVDKILVHNEWDPNSLVNDIALLSLKKPASSSSIELLSEDREQEFLLPGTELTVTGWGWIDEIGFQSEHLHEVKVPFQGLEVCNARDSYNGKVKENMMCAGKVAGGKDSCKGDSGGPATINIDGKNYLVGIVSWGKKCARPKKYGVYTRVSKYKEWITNSSSLP